MSFRCFKILALFCELTSDGLQKLGIILENTLPPNNKLTKDAIKTSSKRYSLGILWEFVGNSLVIFWSFLGDYIGILWKFYWNSLGMYVWLGGFESVILGNFDLIRGQNQSLEA